jgi:hypothetical protein
MTFYNFYIIQVKACVEFRRIHIYISTVILSSKLCQVQRRVHAQSGEEMEDMCFSSYSAMYDT